MGCRGKEDNEKSFPGLASGETGVVGTWCSDRCWTASGLWPPSHLVSCKLSRARATSRIYYL